MQAGYTENMTHAFWNLSLFTAFRACVALLCCIFLMSFPLGLAESRERPANGASPHEMPTHERPDDFADGVKAYRDGDYRAARKSFARLHAEHPENSRVTYYLAISEAQLGRFRQARSLYQEIITLDPNSEAASLAREGLQYLPAEQAALDLPPRFQAQKRTPMSGDDAATPSPAPKQSVVAQPQAASSPMANMSPQDWMMLQMMMGGQGAGGNGMSTMLPYMMMPQMGADPSSPNGMGNIDPSVMSSLLMNQMMQNFSLDGGKDQDR
jgi:hypothetical protein